MTGGKAAETVDKIRSLERDQALKLFFDLINEAESTQPPEPAPSPLTPAGAIPVYKKPHKKGRRQKPGRKSSAKPLPSLPSCVAEFDGSLFTK